MRNKRRHMKINGLPVKDGRRTITLTINARDVRVGNIKDPTGCAAAVACKRELGASEARVHVGRTYIRFNGHWERYRTSPALRTEIVSFDRGHKFEAGEYRLLKMQPSRSNDKSRANPKNRGRGRSRPKKYHVLSGIRPMGLSA